MQCDLGISKTVDLEDLSILHIDIEHISLVAFVDFKFCIVGVLSIEKGCLVLLGNCKHQNIFPKQSFDGCRCDDPLIEVLKFRFRHVVRILFSVQGFLINRSFHLYRLCHRLYKCHIDDLAFFQWINQAG